MKQTIRIIIVVVLSTLLLSACANQETSTATIFDLSVNNKINPIGIDTNPYFSWKMQDSRQGQKQTAYQILVSETEEELRKKKYVWDSGKVESDCSVAIPYAGEQLQEELNYVWKVCVWDADGKRRSSEMGTFEMGKLNQQWEKAHWITAEKEQNAAAAYLTTKYEISYKFKMESTETGFLFGADEGRYGTYYLWKFDASADGATFEMAKMHDEVQLESQKVELEAWDGQAFGAQEHRVRICVKDNQVITYLDDVEIANRNDFEQTPIAAVGLWVDRTSSKAWYDDILVTDEVGRILYQDDFGDESAHMFLPYYLKIEEGWARADAGYVVVPGYEVPAPMFRKSFVIEENKEIASARLYATALGIYDIYVNGADVCEEYAAPGQSYYYEEVFYRTYDITEQLTSGKNAIGFMLGHGRYDRAKEAWGEELALCAQMVIRYTDGTRQVIGTDDTWLVYTDGPVRSDDIYCGEYYDANYEVADWAYANCDESKWKQAKKYTKCDELRKKAALANGVVCLDVLQPISVQEPVKGSYVYDLGQNFNGVCSIRMTGQTGQTVSIRYSEYLNHETLADPDDEMGTIWTKNLFAADNTDYYTFGTDEEVVYTPVFSYRGFRYIQISGIDEAPAIENVHGLVLATDNERTGFFECSDEKMNQLYESIYWTQLSNYVDIPTDCPQRDERFGWTGDAQVYAYTGALNANTNDFINQYLSALRSGQMENGAYLQVAPDWKTTGGANGWSDAGVILVWEMYQQFGNKQVIRENLEAMCRYADYLVETSNEFIRERVDYNDHNAISYMDDACCNTAQCAYVMRLLSDMCTVVQEEALAEKYRDYYQKYRAAWQEKYLGEDGAIGGWLQSEYTMALAYGLYPKELEQSGADKLKISIEAVDYHAMTGYVTTPHILKILCKYGYVDIAYRMVQQVGYPSWNEILANGSTTMTERWDSIYKNADGTISINGSLNHLGLGSMGEWFYTDVLGIKRDESQVAYKHFYLQPYAGGGLTYAKGSFESVYGTIVSEWKVDGEAIRYHFEIPANTSATLTIPGTEYQNVLLESGCYDYEVLVKK